MRYKGREDSEESDWAMILLMMMILSLVVARFFESFGDVEIM